MADEVNCNLCGGTDFYKEAGHYYCSECQTQSQEIHEHVFATPEDVPTARRTSSKKVRAVRKPEDKLTSWECFNYIVLGLVDELIKLGANEKLKQTVRILWFKYLHKLEVIQNDPNAPPRLPALNSNEDAAIVYGRTRQKRKRSRSPSPSSTSDASTMDAASLRKEKSKLRRSLILSQYDEFSNTMQSEDVSLHNQSLVSLKSGSDTSSQDRDKILRYNTKAKKELLKIMTKNHLKAHCHDVDSILDCHKISHRSVSSKYSHGADVVSRSRVYAIIYLGLLIIKDKIQLGDLLRFIREGNLSYHEVDQFFPEELDKKNLNMKFWNQRHTLLTHCGMRQTAAKMAKFIEVTKYVPRQNLVELCRRYCNELNLPDEIMGYTLNLMSKALPKLKFDSHSVEIPNYEGRVMSMIIFVVKLFFGLDEVTENKFSAFAKKFNDSDVPRKRLFIWKNWSYFIYYRKLVLMQHHFPTQYLHDSDNVHNSNVFVGFMTELNARHEQDNVLGREAEVLKRLLEKLKDRQTPLQNRLSFAPSLTPFRDYVEVLLNSTIPRENNYLVDVLTMNFKNDSLEFLTKPGGYLWEINKSQRVGIKHRGANNNLQLVRISNMKCVREQWRRHMKRQIRVKLCKDGVVNSSAYSDLEPTKVEDNITNLDTKRILKVFQQQNMKPYKIRMNKLLKSANAKNLTLQSQVEISQPNSSFLRDCQSSFDALTSQTTQCHSYLFSSPDQNQKERETYIYFNPYERYWLRTFSVSYISQEEFKSFFVRFPDSFKQVFNECARVIEQNPKDLFEEFSDVEVYLCYVASSIGKDRYIDVFDNNLKRSIDKARRNW